MSQMFGERLAIPGAVDAPVVGPELRAYPAPLDLLGNGDWLMFCGHCQSTLVAVAHPLGYSSRFCHSSTGCRSSPGEGTPESHIRFVFACRLPCLPPMVGRFERGAVSPAATYRPYMPRAGGNRSEGQSKRRQCFPVPAVCHSRISLMRLARQSRRQQQIFASRCLANRLARD